MLTTERKCLTHFTTPKLQRAVFASLLVANVESMLIIML